MSRALMEPKLEVSFFLPDQRIYLPDLNRCEVTLTGYVLPARMCRVGWIGWVEGVVGLGWLGAFRRVLLSP